MKKQTIRAAPVELLPAPATPEAQARALDALALGEGPQQAAEAAGVTLGELVTWCASDAAFVAALNRRRRIFHELRRDQLRALAARALDVLAEAVNTVDLTPRGQDRRIAAATALLRAAEALPSPAAGPETAEGVTAALRRDAALSGLLEGL